ncbi:fibropellin-1-like isoform X9 [Dreissena polymorpha]|uniref:fibropellin-1-like isoform X8 n=1 Tax=Dreissena polymorpha TaxID=45954 RepID=UPI002264C4BA|nr:fibropellin-1-like isoform X8 [Dreissena polymorpha]XP_052263868.1 fibropellin-1-like isoform X9 [Dreissena polymorpha]
MNDVFVYNFILLVCVAHLLPVIWSDSTSNMLLPLGICLALTSLSCVNCLTRLRCTDIVGPRHCKEVTECSLGEVCYAQQTTNRYGQVLYDLGCTEPSTCSNRSHGNDSCEECCSTELCNAAGCGQPGYPSGRGPICYSCSSQYSEGSCHIIDFCRSNELCMSREEREFGDTVYISKCELLTHCQNLKGDVPIIGRSILDDSRSLTEITCHKCCHNDLCNANCRTKADSCASNPCVHGRCVYGMTGYTCVCDPMFKGYNCSVQ